MASIFRCLLESKILEEKPYSLAEAGLPGFIRPLHERNASGTELHFGGSYAPVVGDSKTNESHAAPLASRSMSIKASRATVAFISTFRDLASEPLHGSVGKARESKVGKIRIVRQHEKCVVPNIEGTEHVLRGKKVILKCSAQGQRKRANEI